MMPIDLLIYLGIGVLNYALFAGRDNAMLFMAGSRAEGLVEAAFFIILWPAQLIYWLSGRASALMDRLHNGRNT